MKAEMQTVFISDTAADKDPETRAKLQAAVDSEKPTGPCDVVVTHGPRSDKSTDMGFTLTGDTIRAEASDLLDPTKIEAKIRADSGDESITLLKILNGDGLPLYYNGIFRDEFKTRKGRVNKSEVQAESMTAVVWMMKTDPKRAGVMLAAGQSTAIVEEWKAAGKPQV